jgi:hypothetical protein
MLSCRIPAAGLAELTLTGQRHPAACRLCADGVQASPYGVGAVLGSTASKAAWQSPNADRDAGAAAEGCDCMSREERWSGVFGSWPTAVRHWCAKSRCPGGVRWGLVARPVS